MTVKTVALALAAFAAIAFSAQSIAGEKHSHGDKGHADKTHFKVTSPADVKAAWAMITESVAAAEAKADAADESAEKLEVAFHTLEEKSSMVTGEAKARLASVLKQADKATDAFHHSAEEKNAAKAAAELKKIKALLPLIEAQFPAGILK